MVRLDGIFLLFFGLLASTAASEVPQGSADIPIRVFRDGRPVTGLQPEDFSVFVADKLRPDARVSGPTAPGIAAAPSADSQRTRVLVFHLFGDDPSLRDRIRAVLEHVLRPGDRLWLILPTRTVLLPRLGDTEALDLAIAALLPEEIAAAAAAARGEHQNLNRFMDRIREQSFRVVDRHGPMDDGEYTGIHLHYYMKGLKSSLETYLAMAGAYRRGFVWPRVEWLQSLLPRIAPIGSASRAFLFYQAPDIPTLTSKNRRMIRHWIEELADSELYDEQEYARLIFQVLGEIDAVFTTVEAGDADGMSRPFVNAGFELFPLLREPLVPPGEDLPPWWNPIAEPMALAAARSGGRPLTLEDAFRHPDLMEHGENPHYLLCLHPAAGDAGASLRVEVSDRGCRVFHPAVIGPSMQNRDLLTATMVSLGLRQRTLSVSIRCTPSRRDPAAPLDLRVRARDAAGAWVFDRTKSLGPEADTLHVRIGFTALPPGPVTFLVELRDTSTAISELRILRGIIRN